MAKKYSDELRAQVVEMALKGEDYSSLMREHGFHPVTVKYWVDVAKKKSGSQHRDVKESKPTRYFTRNKDLVAQLSAGEIDGLITQLTDDFITKLRSLLTKQLLNKLSE